MTMAHYSECTGQRQQRSRSRPSLSIGAADLPQVRRSTNSPPKGARFCPGPGLGAASGQSSAC
jgi:hypothetical protein